MLSSSAVLIVTHSHGTGLQVLGVSISCSLFELPTAAAAFSLRKVRHFLHRGVRLFLLLRRAHLYPLEGDSSDSQSLWVSQNTQSILESALPPRVGTTR